MSALPQVRRINFADQRIGDGFDSATGVAVGTALEGFTSGVDPNAPGQQVSASITIVNSHEELMSRLGMSFEAQGRYGFMSAEAKASFAESSQYNSTSTFLVAKVVVDNPFTRGSGFRVTEQAHELLTAMRMEEFQRAYGDSFVRGLQTGGEFYCVIRITSQSEAKQSELSASLEAEANGLVASGSFKAAFNTANQSLSTRSEYTATMFQRAGSGTTISPTIEIAEALARYRSFPTIVKESPVAYEAEVATYDTIPLPLPTPEEQEDFLAALADARAKKLAYIQARNDVDFARRNPTFFQDLSDDSVLQATSATYTALLNAVTAHAIKIARGEMSPPRFFEPAALVPPLAEPKPIALVRSKVGDIPVVSLLGLRILTLSQILSEPRRSYADYLAFVDGWFEPGSHFVKPTEKQYDFICSGVNLDYPHKSQGDAGVRAFWSWVNGQTPLDGTCAASDTVTLTTELRSGGWIPDDLAKYWPGG